MFGRTDAVPHFHFHSARLGYIPVPSKSESMHTLAVEASTGDRARPTRRMDVTAVEADQVIEYAATRENLHFERRGGVTYLIEEQ